MIVELALFIKKLEFSKFKICEKTDPPRRRTLERITYV